MHCGLWRRSLILTQWIHRRVSVDARDVEQGAEILANIVVQLLYPRFEVILVLRELYFI